MAHRAIGGSSGGGAASRAVGDAFTRRARAAGYPARSVYKLEHIDKLHRLFRRGQRVMDLGCSPGSWTMYAAQRVGPTGRVVGLDLNALSPSVLRKLPPHVQVYQQDIMDVNTDPDEIDEAAAAAAAAALALDDTETAAEESTELVPRNYFDVVLSDMAPKTTGVKEVDVAASLALCRAAMNMATVYGRHSSSLVIKVFQGTGWTTLADELRRVYSRVLIVRPDAVRRDSVETFMVALRKKRWLKRSQRPSSSSSAATATATAAAATESRRTNK